jgi:AraC-like DNA-binding protein
MVHPAKMKKAVRTILLLHSDERFRDRVNMAGSKEFAVKMVSDWSELRTAIEKGGPSTIAIVDPYYGSASPEPVAGLNETLRSFPSVVVFAGFVTSAHPNEHIRRIESWGVAEIISIGHDDTPEALRSRFRHTEGLALRLLIDGIVPEALPGRGRALVHAAAEVVTAGGLTEHLATALGLSTRTLQRWLRRSGLPPTRTLLAWMRVLLAASLLDDPGRSTASVARACGYASGSSLRRITQSFLGLHPAELRQIGAFAYASRRFIERLDAYRTTPDA